MTNMKAIFVWVAPVAVFVGIVTLGRRRRLRPRADRDRRMEACDETTGHCWAPRGGRHVAMQVTSFATTGKRAQTR